MSKTKVLFCGCKYPYQDRVYGKGNRVHNQGISKTTSSDVWRCTVCGAVKNTDKT